MDEKKTSRYSIKKRSSKVSINHFGKLTTGKSVKDFVDTLPAILAGEDFKELISDTLAAKETGKGVILGLGGHVIKTGVAPYLIALMESGFVSAIAMNGAAMIHDFEIAFQGETSEDVESQIVTGSFGFAEETGKMLNNFINQNFTRKLGLGEIMVEAFQNDEFPNSEYSIIASAGKLNIPLTIHVALGTDIIHMHPECDGASTGQASFIDFKRFCELLLSINGGGGYINFGSAVVLPEVFLKALSLARNKIADYGSIFTANFDFIRHYRPMQSIISRPKLLGANTYSLVGHHEIMIPLFVTTVLENSDC